MTDESVRQTVLFPICATSRFSRRILATFDEPARQLRPRRGRQALRFGLGVDVRPLAAVRCVSGMANSDQIGRCSTCWCFMNTCWIA